MLIYSSFLIKSVAIYLLTFVHCTIYKSQNMIDFSATIIIILYYLGHSLYSTHHVKSL